MEEVTINMPRETFEMAKEFISTLGQALDAADAQIKAGVKATKAGESMDEMMALGAAAAPGLEGFGQELSAMSDSKLGLPL
jgi:hypothetical protein